MCSMRCVLDAVGLLKGLAGLRTSLAKCLLPAFCRTNLGNGIQSVPIWLGRSLLTCDLLPRWQGVVVLVALGCFGSFCPRRCWHDVAWLTFKARHQSALLTGVAGPCGRQEVRQLCRHCAPVSHHHRLPLPLQAAVQIKPEGLPGIAFITWLQKELLKCPAAGGGMTLCVHNVEQGQGTRGRDRHVFCLQSLLLHRMGDGPCSCCLWGGEGKKHGGQKTTSIALHLTALLVSLSSRTNKPGSLSSCPMPGL